MPAISIIIPIYNMEHLMRRCIDSVLKQTFRDIEVILIDDGSTDGSPAICDEYIKVDNRVRVFHKPNGGLSDARNFGLEQARGIYTIFADPDDWVDAEGLDRLYAKAKEERADMVICDLYREDEFARHYVKQAPSALSHEVVLKELFQNIGGFTVNKLIRRELYDLYKIRYPKGIYGCEDQYVMAQFLTHDIKIAYEPVAFYHYMYNSSSLTRYYDERTYQMDVHILDMFTSLLQGNPAQDAARKNKHDAIFTRAFWNGGRYYSSRKFHERFKDYRTLVFQLQEQFIVKCCMYMACMFFFRPANRVVFWLFRIKRMLKRIGACK